MLFFVLNIHTGSLKELNNWYDISDLYVIN